jgi:hypothetical protein
LNRLPGFKNEDRLLRLYGIQAAGLIQEKAGRADGVLGGMRPADMKHASVTLQNPAKREPERRVMILAQQKNRYHSAAPCKQFPNI